MTELTRYLLTLHVFANVVWIGSILSVAYVAAKQVGEVGARCELARQLYMRVANPAFVASFVAGALILFSNLQFYLVQEKWMHGKLLFALIVIALHHVIGAKVKRAETGQYKEVRKLKPLGIGLSIAALITVFFAVVRPF